MAYITSRSGPEPGAGLCGSYLQIASKTFAGGPASSPPGLAQELKYARCIRAQGVPKFPNPLGSGETYAGNLEPNGAALRNAGKISSEKTGTRSGSQPEPPASIIGGLAALPGSGLRPVSAVPGSAVPPRNSWPGANG
jgi:hypothetical protein